MDGQRFDKLAKTLARWTSRRRFLAALGGGAGWLLHQKHGQAQEQSPEAESDGFAQIAERSALALSRLPEVESVVNQEFDDRLPVFIGRLRELAEFGSNAGSWNDDQLQGFLTTVRLLPAGVSAGTDSYLDQWARDRINELGGEQCESDPGLPDEEIVLDRPTSCTTPCCVEWAACDHSCADTDHNCIVECFWNFIECFTWVGEDGNPCTVSSKCLPAILYACAGDCRG